MTPIDELEPVVKQFAGALSIVQQAVASAILKRLIDALRDQERRLHFLEGSNHHASTSIGTGDRPEA